MYIIEIEHICALVLSPRISKKITLGQAIDIKTCPLLKNLNNICKFLLPVVQSRNELNSVYISSRSFIIIHYQVNYPESILKRQGRVLFCHDTLDEYYVVLL